ncbi:MAG TPA: DNA translocase FtsK 4TM domain-containing protein, partial [Flavobacterium sp.]|nr:DNA translocase FtsK 4TM domain-containing protein [Flavobacterium sp.]
MAKPTEKNKTKQNKIDSENSKWKFTRKHVVFMGFFLIIIAIAMSLSFISYYINWQEDQSAVQAFGDRNVSVKNWLGKTGASVAHFFLYKGFGVASFLIVRLLFITGLYMVLNFPAKKLKDIWFWDLFAMVNFSLMFGFFASVIPELGGVIGYEMNQYFQDFLGKAGIILLLVFSLFIYLIFKVNISVEKIQSFFERNPDEAENDSKSVVKSPDFETQVANTEEDDPSVININKGSTFEINKELLKPTIENPSEIVLDTQVSNSSSTETKPEIITTDDEAFVIEKAAE